MTIICTVGLLKSIVLVEEQCQEAVGRLAQCKCLQGLCLLSVTDTGLGFLGKAFLVPWRGQQ
jgi:hypothetical protein